MPSSSQMRATLRERDKQYINQTSKTNRRKKRPKTCSFRHLLPERLRNRYRTQKNAFRGPRGVPGGSRELPESPPSDSGASLGGLRSTPGTPPERPTRPTELRRAQTTLWELKKLPPEASGTPFWKGFAIVSDAILIELFIHCFLLLSLFSSLLFSLPSSPTCLADGCCCSTSKLPTPIATGGAGMRAALELF